MDMEVAGQWQREWAGTAEYGKVTEGGITRRVARAVEVLHASAPGARVRVLRAAYHSSAGPGAPASSYMMHSSRQVLSSGYNFLEPSSLPIKPLEISSTPLESSPDSETEKENYKVTEPDDYEISEPSKWRSASGKNSMRMPSEESSSTDNASIIDLDSRSSSRSTLRRNFPNNQNEDIKRIHNINTRVSPLLDAPVALSTLKYTSLLNGGDDWNSRRKSYSFEDTSPLNNISHRIHSITMDSSTDSGICKSTEIVDDQVYNGHTKITKDTEIGDTADETFQDWLFKNRSNSFRRNRATPSKSLHITESQSTDSKIMLQSSGKVTITLPLQSEKSKQPDNSASDDFDRRTKKVEFCKTELHFTADTGTVNIIATDEKPPPSNDFRRRRSAFVPLTDKFERSITLFGEKSESESNNNRNVIPNCEFGESDENTAATKSILKNKIPKPKPYLLGENMVFGANNNDYDTNGSAKIETVQSAVSIINKQLQSERRYSNETISSCTSDTDSRNYLNNSFRAGVNGPPNFSISNTKKTMNKDIIGSFKSNSLRNNLKVPPDSPTLNRAKVRELRGTDLAYFGIENIHKNRPRESEDNLQEEILHSVKLVQRISNSVCNSEAESDDTPEYQNVSSLQSTVTPTPKPRTRYGEEVGKSHHLRILKPITEQEVDIKDQNESIRSCKKQEIRVKSSQRNIMESPTPNQSKQRIKKVGKDENTKKPASLVSGKTEPDVSRRVKSNKENITTALKQIKTTSESPLYVNIKQKRLKNPSDETQLIQFKGPTSKNESKLVSNSSRFSENLITVTGNPVKSTKTETQIELKKQNQHSLPRKPLPRRTEKLVTPDKCGEKSINGHTHSYETKHKCVNNVVSKDKRNPYIKNSEENSSTGNNKDCKNKILNKDIVQITKIKNDTDSQNTSNSKRSHKVHRGTLNSQQSIKPNMNHEKQTETKMDKSTKSRRSKYVINYDDKNGTVSSICKIKSGPGTYKRKMITVEKKDPQEYAVKDININKIALRK